MKKTTPQSIRYTKHILTSLALGIVFASTTYIIGYFGYFPNLLYSVTAVLYALPFYLAAKRKLSRSATLCIILIPVSLLLWLFYIDYNIHLQVSTYQYPQDFTPTPFIWCNVYTASTGLTGKAILILGALILTFFVLIRILTYRTALKCILFALVFFSVFVSHYIFMHIYDNCIATSLLDIKNP